MNAIKLIDSTFYKIVFKFFKSNFIFSLLFLLPISVMGQCPGTACAYTITGSDSGSYQIMNGDKICFDPGADFTGSITLRDGELINCATAPQSFNLFFISTSVATVNNYGTLNLISDLDIKGTSVTINNYDSITVNGILTSTSGSNVIINNNGPLDVTSDIDLFASATLNNTDLITANGAIDVASGSSFNNFGTTSATDLFVRDEVINSGTLTIANNLNIVTTGQLTNTGDITANGWSANGQWSNSGLMTITNSCVFSSTSSGTISGGCISCSDFTNNSPITGTTCGNILVAAQSFQTSSGSLLGDIAFVDATPPGAAPFIDINSGTVGPNIVWSSCTSCAAGPTEEICDNDIDDDGDGLVDCLDPDCESIYYAVNELNAPGVIDPLNAIGSPDGLNAILDLGESILLDLGNAIDVGTIYSIHLGSLNGGFDVEESIDGVNFFPNANSPFVASSPASAHDFTATHHARFIRITYSSSNIGTALNVDALEYMDCICQPAALIAEYKINTDPDVVGTNVSINIGDDLKLDFSGTFNDGVFIWSGPNGLYQINDTGNFRDPLNLFNIQPNQSGVYTAYRYDALSCVDSVSFTVTVIEDCGNGTDDDGDGLVDCLDPDCLSFELENDQVCSNLTIVPLSGQNPLGGTFSGPGVSGTNFDANSVGAGMHPITYTYTYTSGSGCTHSVVDSVLVLACPTDCDDGIDNDGDGFIDGNDLDGEADNDEDGICDFIDLDDDNDGIPDRLECIGEINLGFEGPTSSGNFPQNYYLSDFDFNSLPNIRSSRTPDFISDANTLPASGWFVPIEGGNFAALQADNNDNTLTDVPFSNNHSDGILIQYSAVEMANFGINIGDDVAFIFNYAPGHNYDIDIRDADADTELKVWVSSSTVDGVFPTPTGGSTITIPPTFVLVPGAWAPSNTNAQPNGNTDIMTNQWLESVTEHTYLGGDFTILFLPGVGAIDSGAENIFLDNVQLIICPDTDMDGLPDYLDLDSDNDGIYDLVEAGHTALDDDDDGIIDGSASTFGSNGLFDGVETTADSDTINYTVINSNDPTTGRYDAYELDSDEDGCFDAEEELVIDGDGDGLAGTGTPVVDGAGRVIGANYNDPIVNTWQMPLRGACLLEICGDGIDNDLDGLVDCNDISCPPAEIVYTPPNCPGESAVFSAVDLGPNAIYTWDFGGNTSPSSANGVGPHTVTFINCESGVVSLFVDELGCIGQDTLHYAVSDSDSPTYDLSTFVSDTIIHCGNPIPSPNTPAFVDDCGNPSVQFLETNNKGSDRCNQHNYQITRTWTATDGCGNETVAIQTIAVRDTNFVCAGGDLIGGFAFLDGNYNGINDENYIGILGIDVYLFEEVGGISNLVAQTVTTVDGFYSFNTNITSQSTFRVEFVIPDEMPVVFTANGINNGSNVQFVTSPDCNVSVGLANPDRVAAPPIGIGNRVWMDTNADGIQGVWEDGIANVTVLLYNSAGDIVSTQLTDSFGEYYFDHLTMGDSLLREYDTYYLAIGGSNYDSSTQLLNDSLVLTSLDIGELPNNDINDNDAIMGIVTDVAWVQNHPFIQAITTDRGVTNNNFDFGFVPCGHPAMSAPCCDSPITEYAITNGAITKPGQTTNYFYDNASIPPADVMLTQQHGTIRATQFCQIGNWNYYLNPNDPESYLFAIEHGNNVTPIEYIDVRVDDIPSDRYAINSSDATFVMARDWFVKTTNDDPLLDVAGIPTTVNIRFYFPEEEFKEIIDEAIAEATAWGGSVPTATDAYWFKRDTFDPNTDIDPAGSLIKPYDITTLQAAGTSALGVNTADGVVGDAGNGKNHIQFNGINSFSGGTAAITINKIALPIALINFTADQNECDVVLNWKAESETDFSHYLIESSEDGVDFKFVESILATQSNGPKFYSHIDKQVIGKKYYRLNFVNLDGTYTYSDIILINTDCQSSISKLNIYPNPIAERITNLNIDFSISKTESVVWLTIINTNGTELLKMPIDATMGENSLSVDISNLGVGTYLVNLKKTKGKVLSSRFVKVRE